jgi:hypothetical protein
VSAQDEIAVIRQLFHQCLHLVLIRLALIARHRLRRQDAGGAESRHVRIGKGAYLVARRSAQHPIDRRPARLPENVQQGHVESAG